MRVPAALLSIPLLVGSLTGVLVWDSAPETWSLCAAAAAVLAAASATAALADESFLEATAAIVIGALAAGLSLGLSAARDTYGRGADLPAGEPLVLVGRLREDAVSQGNGATLTLDVLEAAAVGRKTAAIDRSVGVRLGITGAAASAAVEKWRAGRWLRLTAIVHPPATYRNFGVPDEARALARRGIVLVGNVKSGALVEVVGRGSIVEEAAGRVRAWSRRRLAQSIGRYSGRSAAVASAILIGDRSGIADDDARRLQQAGTYHVIAISGGNIAILTGLLLLLMRLARLPPRLASSLTIVALLFYGQLTGAPPSVARAITAAVVYLAARLFDHRGPALNALAIAAGAAIAAHPFSPLDPGFILSFGATLGILLGVPRLVRPPERLAGTSRLRWAARGAAFGVAALFSATLFAETALFPVGATLFARVTFAGLLLNFLAIPLMTIAQAASIGTLAASGIASVGDGAAYVSHLATVGLVESARLVEVLPWLSIDVLPPALWLVGLYYGACLVILCRRDATGVVQPFTGCLPWIAPLALATSVVLILVSPGFAQRGGPVPPRHGLLRVVFLDVGQGDATLVQLPGGCTLLVDAGGLPGSTFDAGERVVAPALRALGVGRLDVLVITHADPDHIGGAASVMRRFAPRAVWEGVPVPPNAALRELSALASAQAAIWRTVQSGDLERVDGVQVRVWHPPPPDWERQRVRNDDSVVVELRLGDVSILLTGDIEREAERALAPRLALAPIVVLKAPHHGSATSSSDAFIAVTRPAAVIASAGQRNPFGHPHPAVVARYRAAGVEMFRTDEDGAIVVDTDGRSVSVRTFSGRWHRWSRAIH
jgi:competence protein ComEC